MATGQNWPYVPTASLPIRAESSAVPAQHAPHERAADATESVSPTRRRGPASSGQTTPFDSDVGWTMTHATAPTSSPIPTADIPFDALRARLLGGLLRPGDAGYDDARTIWNAMFDRRPAAIVQPLGTADVVECDPVRPRARPVDRDQGRRS